MMTATPSLADAKALQIASLQVERAALVSAIASGATSCSYEGKSVSYDDLAGMKRRINFVDGQIAALAGLSVQKPQAGFATFRRGYNTRRAGYGGFYGSGC